MKRAHIYLEDGLLRSARQGTHNFIALLAAGLERRGLEVSFLSEDHLHPHDPTILDVFHMDGPRDRPPLYFRRVYSYPFWTIETTPERWTGALRGPRLILMRWTQQRQRNSIAFGGGGCLA